MTSTRTTTPFVPPLTIVTTPPCIGCGEVSRLHLPTEGVRAYRAGALAQVAFPTLSVDERELAISGTHPTCWDDIIG